MSTPRPSAVRIDQLLVTRGLAPSRERAKALVLAGVVLVDDTPIEKPGTTVREDAAVRLKGAPGDDWASRGALKLQPALDAFRVDPGGKACLDVGASTGGFTDVLLRRGARRVYAVDVGYGQLDWRLRSDPRVVVLDRQNARQLTAAEVPEPIELCVVDVSFISLTLVLPALRPLLAGGADLLAMVKPQFEVGKGRVGKGGVVRDEALRREALDAVARAAEALGLQVLGERENDVHGPKGNIESFLHLRAP